MTSLKSTVLKYSKYLENNVIWEFLILGKEIIHRASDKASMEAAGSLKYIHNLTEMALPKF